MASFTDRPAFLDRDQLYHDVQDKAIPLLEALAANEIYRNYSLRRFDRDDPPPYVSSTESGELDDYCPTPSQDSPLPEDLRAIMEGPIEDQKIKFLALGLENLATPRHFYYTEVKLEEERLEHYQSVKNTMFRKRKGSRRLGVMARRNVKRRWEKLGIWNPEWGFPGRNMQPGDYINEWKWRWEQSNADGSGSGDLAAADARQLVARALRLRYNLPRGEKAPSIPRSRLKQDVTVSEAESFIISRPWFIFQIEVNEEIIRYDRLSMKKYRHNHSRARKQVIEWWKERGDWREEFNRSNDVTSWKWRYESPSPEPEDLTPLDKMKDGPLDITEMDFTPSEIDDLETIELSSPEQPENYWEIKDGAMPPYFPGQQLNPAKRAAKAMRQRAEQARHDRADSLSPRESPRYKELLEQISLLRRPINEASPKEHEDTPEESKENTSKPQQDTRSLLKQNPIRDPPCQHQRQQRSKVNRFQDLDPDQPRLRRSARIAGIKRPTELLLSQTVPKKNRRDRAALNAVAPPVQPVSRETRHTKTKPVPARQLPKGERTTRLDEDRGRRTKENRPSIRSIIEDKIPAAPASARTRTGGAVATDALAVPRPKGRPRKKK